MLDRSSILHHKSSNIIILSSSIIFPSSIYTPTPLQLANDPYMDFSSLAFYHLPINQFNHHFIIIGKKLDGFIIYGFIIGKSHPMSIIFPSSKKHQHYNWHMIWCHFLIIGKSHPIPSHPTNVPSHQPGILPMRPTCSSKPHSNIRSASSSTSRVTRSKVTSPWDGHGWSNHGENAWEMLGKWLENRSHLGKITTHGGKSMETGRIYHRCCRWI